MLPRFVVVPAIPKEAAAKRRGIQPYRPIEPICFDIYDNQQKRRLEVGYASCEEAEKECQRLNTFSDARYRLKPTR
jgi:hypothetical protein